MGVSPKQLSQWLGNGVPNISRVIECTKERITLIGLGALKKDEGDIFRLPLPVDFSSRLMKRKLTVTLSYLSPIAPNKQKPNASAITVAKAKPKGPFLNISLGIISER